MHLTLNNWDLIFIDNKISNEYFSIDFWNDHIPKITNPAYYEKLRERLEQIIEQEEKRRKGDASYFDSIAEVYNRSLA